MQNISKTIISVLVIVAIGIFVYYLVNKTPTQTNPPVVNEGTIAGCYVAHLQKDIYTLVIQSGEQGKIVGRIAYNNFQKDSSSGSFEGTFADGILQGNYSFDSEGVHSVRQLIFKKTGDTFVQGFGEAKVVGNKEVFDDLSRITYDPKSTFVKSKNCTEKFIDSNNTLTFDFNSYFKTNEGQNILSTDWRQNTTKQGLLLVNVYIPKTYMPNTNLADARFTVGRSNDANEIKSCMNDAVNGEVKHEVVLISGYPFTKFSLSEGAAGNFYETTSYRGIVDGDCYVVEYTIHSMNIDNYPDNQDIKEFDKAKIQNIIEQIIQSLKFLINSD